MNEPIISTQAQARSYLDKAETFLKLGLRAQVQHELELARRVDPYIAEGIRYKTLVQAVAAATKKVDDLKIPLRIGAGMLFANALVSAFFLVLIFISGGGSGLSGGDIIGPLVNLIVGVNLWQIKPQWQKYTVVWAAIGLILFGAGALLSGDYFSVITQLGFSGSLIILLAGTPTKVRTIAAVAIYVVMYLGMLCLLFALLMLGVI